MAVVAHGVRDRGHYSLRAPDAKGASVFSRRKKSHPAANAHSTPPAPTHVAGMLAWFAPGLVGGGDVITQRTLVGAESLAIIPFVFLLRLGLGAVSYAAGTPGGLFAPLLVLGALLGLLFGGLCRLAFPALDTQPEAFAVVAMAAFFTGVVRAPVTHAARPSAPCP